MEIRETDVQTVRNDKAGFRDIDGDGFRENPNGTPLRIEIQVVNGWSDRVWAVQMIVDYLTV